MTRLLPVCIVIVMAAVLMPGTASAAPGTGGVTINRLPWREGEGTNVQHPGQIQPTQGWFGHTSHFSQFGEDWANSGNSFLVVAATESKGQYGAECTPWDQQSSSGNYVKVLRPGGTLTDWYFHLEQGVCNDYPVIGGTYKKHVEQGDEIDRASNTGTGGIHLHYEPRGPGGGPADSVWHSLSGIMNFCDHDDSGQPDEHDGELGYTCRQAHHNEWYTSDNTGPGVGDGIPGWTAGAIWLAYSGIGHYLCGGKAWDCFGSSFNSVTEGRKAVSGCLPSWPECGWSQDFKERASSGGENHGFGKPNACGVAYWVPDGFFWAWLYNADDLGFPRSNMYYEPTNPIGLPTSRGWYQWFRYGYLYSSSTPANASPYYQVQTTGCS